MNGEAVKARNRDIIRAFGPETVELIDRHAKAINELGQDLLTVTAKQRAHGELAADHAMLLDAHRQAFQILQRGFIGRLRWLVLGR